VLFFYRVTVIVKIFLEFSTIVCFMLRTRLNDLEPFDEVLEVIARFWLPE
jgi:hypothetical protein